jgi:glycosyltransferase involved in cell wall biosynthesis
MLSTFWCFNNKFSKSIYLIGEVLGIKALHIIWNAKFGGIEKMVFELAEEQLQSKMVEPSVLIAKAEGEFLERFKSAGFKTHFLKFEKGLELNYLNFKAAINLFKKYDVLHFHFFNPVLAFAAYFTKKKIVYSEHGNFGFGREKKKFDRLLIVLKKWFLKNSKVLIVYNSNFTKQYAETHLGLSNHSRSSVVTNGINLSTYLNKNKLVSHGKQFDALKEQLNNKFVIGTSSRFAGFKRIDRLINSFNRIPDAEKTVLLLVGDGVLMSSLRKQVDELNLNERVIFTGFIKEIKEYQELMDVCVFASESEPFGLVAIETLSLGKPTIVFKNGGGLVEIIEGINKKDIVEDEKGLAERIDFYRKYPNEIKLNQDSIIEYSKQYSIQSVAEKLVTIYQNKD